MGGADIAGRRNLGRVDLKSNLFGSIYCTLFGASVLLGKKKVHIFFKISDFSGQMTTG